MNPQQCRYLLTLAEVRNFSKAAAALFVSQPYLSKLVASIECELGVPIFERARKPFTITPAGETYLTYLRELLYAEQKMRTQVDEISAHRAGSIRLGIPMTHGSYILPDILRTFKRLYPGVQIRVEEQNNKVLMEHLFDGLLDFAILSLPDYPREVTNAVIARENILLVLPPEHPLGQRWAKGNVKNPPPFPPDQVPLLNDEKCLVLMETQGMGKYARMIFAELNIQPEVFMETRNIETAYRLAAVGAGFTLIPEICTRFSRFSEEPYYFTLGSPPYNRSVSILYLKRRLISKTEQDFIEIARNAMDAY